MRYLNRFLLPAILLVVSSGAGAWAGTVKFVGCPANGMMGPLPAPVRGRNVVIPEPGLADSLAYYKAGDGFGVFAPIGWQCREWYGSGSITLLVMPNAVPPSYNLSRKTTGSAVTVTSVDGGTSGGMSALRLISQLFPGQDRTFVKEERAEEKWIYIPKEKFTRYLGAKDSVRRLAQTLLEFTTPPRSVGFGTRGILLPSAQPIAGLVMLLPPKTGPGLIIVRIRLPPTQQKLLSVILNLIVERHSP